MLITMLASRERKSRGKKSLVIRLGITHIGLGIDVGKERPHG